MINNYLVTFWELLSSKGAMIFYIITMLVIFAVLIISILFFEKRREIENKETYGENTDKKVYDIVNKVSEKVAEENKKIKDEIVDTKELVRDIKDGSVAIGGAKGGQTIKKEDINTTDVRFFMLKRIDEAYENYKAPQYNNEITLKEICEDFRNFASYKLKLYYDILDIRRFIAGLAVTKLIILQGMSGTGKTSLPYA
nr:hypothetical protein [Acholeplasmatales bacterium]